jgi:zinc transport system substrate-binding protein
MLRATRVHRLITTVTVAVALLSAASCGSDQAGAKSNDGSDTKTIDVVASFYPLQYVVERVGGNKVSVANLTPMGAEPHELELTGRDTAALEDADLVVYLSHFAPAVDEGVRDVAGGHALDVGEAANLDLRYTPIEGGEEAAADANTRDPHFWLDPTRLEAVTNAVADRLATIDPADAPVFAANAQQLVTDLQQLDGEYSDGLASCANTVIVTSHNAFGYLAQRYGLTQIGITGLTPEDEPSPGDLATITDFVEAHHVSTIYYETLVSPAIARTVGEETGARTAVLDPIEGLSDSSNGEDYFSIMRANLANLRAGQRCT